MRAEVRFHNSEDDRREEAENMLKGHVRLVLGHDHYDADIEHFGAAVLAFADEWAKREGGRHA